MLERTVVVGSFQCNCKILACPKTGDAVVIDPGDEPERILKALTGLKTPTGADVTVKHLFHTHAHLDHVGGTRGVKSSFSPVESPKIHLHRDDEPLYQALKVQGQMFGMNFEDPLPVDAYFSHGQELEVGTLKFQIVHTPGHSPGSVCLRLKEDSTHHIPEMVLSGDTLFQGSIGRSDLWGGNHAQLIKSIKERILTLDGDIRVCPGHGPDTRVGVEKRSNPYLS